MATQRQRRRPKTWSVSGETRRVPSEYEIVSTRLNYHFRKQPAPFELDPGAPLNRWYLKHREGSPLQVEDWDAYRDPHKLTYRHYIQQQNEREGYVDGLIDRFEAVDHDGSLSPGWVELLERIYLPSRFSGHILQMCSLYVAQIAPSSLITNIMEFQAADEMRRIQRLAYRAKSLSLEHSEELASSERMRAIWEDDEVWQPLRETLENLLVVYDWGEALATLNLGVKPAYDELLNMQLARLAERNGDGLMALMLDDFARDCERSRRSSKALAEFAIAGREENRALLHGWSQEWAPRTQSALEPIAAAFANAPVAADPSDVTGAVVQAHRDFLADCGLE